MGRNLNTTVWSVDQNGYTQTLSELFTGETPVYTHAQHIDDSFNFCVNGVFEQNKRAVLHLTNRETNDYTIENVDCVFIPNKIYDTKGNIGMQAVNTILGGSSAGNVSNFAIDPDDLKQPAGGEFKICVNFNYLTSVWSPRIHVANINSSTGVINNELTYTLNDMDGVSSAEDATNNETWWEYYKRKETNYILWFDYYLGEAYYSNGAFQSTSVFEGETRRGVGTARLSWLNTPHQYGNTLGTSGCCIYKDNNRAQYSDYTLDVLFSWSADIMVKKAEWDDESYNKTRHNIIWGIKIDKDIILRLISSYGLPFSFTNVTNISIGHNDYALPEIKNNTTTGNYFRGAAAITADTDNNRWANTADIDNKPASGGGGGGGGDELVEMPSRGQFYGSGITTYYVDPPTAKLQTALGNWDNVQTGKDVLKNLISYKLLCFPQRLFTNGMLHDFVIAGTTLKDSDNNTIQAAKLTQYGSVNLPSIVIPRTFNDFRDYAPYTNMSMYVPLCGWFQLPPWCMGRTISGEMYINGYTGTVKCIVRADGNVITELGGNAAVDLPFTAEAVGMKSAAVLSNIINTAGSIGAMVANPSIGSAANVGTSVLGTVCALNANYTESKGTMGDGSNIAGLYNVYIKISRPATVDNNGNSLIAIPTEYKRQYGLPCNKSLTLTQGDGYTQILDANITGNMTAREKQMIIDGFRRGLIL